MTSIVALLRAVNVGGTGVLPMTDLVALCEAAGFRAVRTFIASGNVVFEAAETPAEAARALEARLQARFGRPVGVLARTAGEMAEIVARNPFPDAPPNRVAVLFLDHDTSPSTLDGVAGQVAGEQLVLGPREIYVWYGAGMGRSRLRIPSARRGTARNINTVTRLARMAAE